jgi:hypothetical protein
MPRSIYEITLDIEWCTLQARVKRKCMLIDITYNFLVVEGSVFSVAINTQTENIKNKQTLMAECESGHHWPLIFFHMLILIMLVLLYTQENM